MFRVTEVDADVFHARLSAARDEFPDIARHTILLNRSTYDELYACYMVQQEYMVHTDPCFQASGGPRPSQLVAPVTLNAGFAIENDGKRRLRCMFNATVPHQKLGKFMVKQAVELGARALNCPNDWRVKLYRSFGFVETHKLVYMEVPHVGS